MHDFCILVRLSAIIAVVRRLFSKYTFSWIFDSHDVEENYKLYYSAFCTTPPNKGMMYRVLPDIRLKEPLGNLVPLPWRHAVELLLIGYLTVFP